MGEARKERCERVLFKVLGFGVYGRCERANVRGRIQFIVLVYGLRLR